MKDEGMIDFKQFEGFCRRTDISDCRVTFATENCLYYPRWVAKNRVMQLHYLFVQKMALLAAIVLNFENHNIII